VDYKNSKIKQYHKESKALRTETTINNTNDFDIGKGSRCINSVFGVGAATFALWRTRWSRCRVGLRCCALI